MASITVRPGDDGTTRRRLFPRRWYLLPIGVFVVAGLWAGIHTWRDYKVLTSAKYSVVTYNVPTAPHLIAAKGETVYRIDPTHSSVSYAVDERLFGHDAHRAVGTTNGIAGDIALNASQPSASRVGQIVVNVQQLHSDNDLRDARMRASALDSHDYPLANLTVASFSGMPASIADGTSYHFTMMSQLTVKNTPAAVTWNVVASVANGKLTATATADVKMSTWGIGPISIAGLVSTSNNVTLTMKLTALNPSKYTIPTEIAAPKSAPRSHDSVSFDKVIMPILEANCASCHNPGQVGAAHWTLDTAADAASIPDGLGSVVSTGYMPPWPASANGVALLGSKRLDQADIDAIVKWSAAGGPLDVPASTKIRPAPGGPYVAKPRHDLTLRMPQAYAGSLSVPNDYRCFVLNPNFTKPTFMTGYEVTPDHRAEIHHVQIFHIDASQVAAAAKISGSDGKPGWSCYGTVDLPSTEHHHQAGRVVRGFTGQAGLIAGWVPGQDPTIYPDHSGILFQPGDALVLQVHYHYDTTPVPDRTSVAIQTDPGTDNFKKIDIINPIAPVEIPCPAGVTAPLCNRNAALADDVKEYGPIGSSAEAGLLALCGETSDQLAASYHDGVASSTCNYQVPESGTIVSVFGHEHTLGKSFRLTLDPSTSHPTVLLDIPTWNFDWQMNYGLAKPIHVNAGQTIQMSCSWDRALDPNRPPKYIVFAEGTEDEMCFSTYAIIPDNQG